MADVWALGVALYQLLIGRPPFITEFMNHKQLFQQMMISNLVLPNDLPKGAKDLLQKMIAPESARASLEAVMLHPWLSFYQFRVMKKRPKRQNKRTLYRVVRHVLRFVFKGPFPPPSEKYI
ncbi:hypothetical protein K501DRAFT_289084 [Backusella circina FSU 941]|nr:hypothetical protein K501DRAFT_289084 [Backusella circina FSU 941]